jgi:hypothetical protein
LKLGWRKFSLLVRTALVGALAGGATITAKQPARANELTLAGLRPGRDSLQVAKKRLRDPAIPGTKDDPSHFMWVDSCNKRVLTVEAAANELVKSVQVSPFEAGVIDCVPSAYFPRAKDHWRTGRGLGLGDSCGRVVELYGKPESESPSAKGNEQLELFFYSFDWAGADVPQVMEVTCSRESDRVVEILLAASSL